MNLRYRAACALPVIVACAGAAHAQRAYVFSKGCGAPLATNRLYELDLPTGRMFDLGGRDECNIEGLAIVNGRLIASTESSSFNPRPQWGFWDFTEAPGFKVGPFPFVQRFGVDHDIDVDPTTGILYALQGADSRAPSGSSWLYEIDQTTYEHTLIGVTEDYVDSLAINSRGEAFAVDIVFDQVLYSVDLSTGGLTLIGQVDVPFCCGSTGTQAALGFDDEDTLWMITSGSVGNFSRVFTLDPATGETTFVANMDSVIPGVNGFAVDSMAMILGFCPADCDRSGSLDVFDFLCFQDLFVAGDPRADCNGSGALNIFDFACFQDAFAAGCP